MRAAASDLYYNSWRFLAGNILFGITFLAFLAGLTIGPWGWALSIAAILPAAGCMRMATTLVRDGHTSFGEFTAVMRRPLVPLGVGLAQLLVVLMLVVDLTIGLAWTNLLGIFLAITAVYGLVIGWAYAVIAWPLVLDPVRDADPLRARLRLAVVLLFAHPVRMGTLAALVGAVLVASTVAVAAIVTIALAFAFLVVARYVLPAADRIEGRATVEIEE